jgi:predicted transcriptional regulator
MMEEILISLEPQHAENILRGTKRIELRTRRMNLRNHARIWLYAKLPFKSIVGFANFEKMLVETPKEMWGLHSEHLGIASEEFFTYFSGREKAFGICLRSPARLNSRISLDTLRAEDPSFTPPQFFKRLDKFSRVLLLLQRQIDS